MDGNRAISERKNSTKEKFLEMKEINQLRKGEGPLWERGGGVLPNYKFALEQSPSRGREKRHDSA